MNQQEALQQSLLERGHEIALRGAMALSIIGGAATAAEIAMPADVAFADHPCVAGELADLPPIMREIKDANGNVVGVEYIEMCSDKPTPTTKPPVTNPPATNPPATNPPVKKPPTTTAAPTTVATTTTVAPTTTEVPTTTVAPTTTELVTTTTVELDPATTTTYVTITTQEKPVEPVIEPKTNESSAPTKAILAGSLALALAGAAGGRKLFIGFKRRKNKDQ